MGTCLSRLPCVEEASYYDPSPSPLPYPSRTEINPFLLPADLPPYSLVEQDFVPVPVPPPASRHCPPYLPPSGVIVPLEVEPPLPLPQLQYPVQQILSPPIGSSIPREDSPPPPFAISPALPPPQPVFSGRPPRDTPYYKAQIPLENHGIPQEEFVIRLDPKAPSPNRKLASLAGPRPVTLPKRLHIPGPLRERADRRADTARPPLSYERTSPVPAPLIIGTLRPKPASPPPETQLTPPNTPRLSARLSINCLFLPNHRVESSNSYGDRRKRAMAFDRHLREDIMRSVEQQTLLNDLISRYANSDILYREENFRSGGARSSSYLSTLGDRDRRSDDLLADDIIRRVNLIVQVVNNTITTRNTYGEVHPKMASDGRYPRGFERPHKVEDILNMDSAMLDRLLSCYNLPRNPRTSSSSSPLSIGLRNLNSLSLADTTGGSRASKLAALLEYLGVGVGDEFARGRDEVGLRRLANGGLGNGGLNFCEFPNRGVGILRNY